MPQVYSATPGHVEASAALVATSNVREVRGEDLSYDMGKCVLT